MDYKKLRKSLFNKDFPLNQSLIDDVKHHPSHGILQNPTSHNIYVYLIEYLSEFSKQWFNRSDIKVLDWGTGKGHISYILNGNGVDVTSCDIESDALDSTFGQDIPLIKKNNIEVIPLKHPYILPFEDNSFDVVLSFGVLEHVPNDLESLKELNRVLKPNGLLFCFFLPYTYSWTQKVDRMRGGTYHDRLYNYKIVNQLLEKSNFNLIDFWHRALLPKNTIKYPSYRTFDKIDNWLGANTFLKHLATNVEFVASKPQ